MTTEVDLVNVIKVNIDEENELKELDYFLDLLDQTFSDTDDLVKLQEIIDSSEEPISNETARLLKITTESIIRNTGINTSNLGLEDFSVATYNKPAVNSQISTHIDTFIKRIWDVVEKVSHVLKTKIVDSIDHVFNSLDTLIREMKKLKDAVERNEATYNLDIVKKDIHTSHMRFITKRNKIENKGLENIKFVFGFLNRYIEDSKGLNKAVDQVVHTSKYGSPLTDLWDYSVKFDSLEKELETASDVWLTFTKEKYVTPKVTVSVSNYDGHLDIDPFFSKSVNLLKYLDLCIVIMEKTEIFRKQVEANNREKVKLLENILSNLNKLKDKDADTNKMISDIYFVIGELNHNTNLMMVLFKYIKNTSTGMLEFAHKLNYTKIYIVPSKNIMIA